MLSAIAVALVLTSPLPVPKPALDAPQAAPAPAPAPTEAEVVQQPRTDGSADGSPDRDADAGRDGGTAPVPPERPATYPQSPERKPEPQAEPAPQAQPAPKARPVPEGEPAPEAPATGSDPDADARSGAAATPAAPPAGTARQGITPPDMVCRDPRLSGAALPMVVGGIPGCVIVDPVRVTSIAGIRLSAPVTLECRTARRFADWLTGTVRPAARDMLGSGVASVRIMGSYVCRTRNNLPGERLSEHSVGRAVDVGGMTLLDGRRISVSTDWGKGAPGTFLERIREDACGGFNTVIGPGTDSYHRTHFHLDTAYRDSTWCH